MFSVDRGQFVDTALAALAAGGGRVAVPVSARLMSDQLTPVLAYRRLVAADERAAPSFLLESVEGGERQGRHSILGAQPAIEFVARERAVRVRDRRSGEDRALTCDDPLSAMRALTADVRLAAPEGSASAGPMIGGWAGYASYDSVRYAEPGKLPFAGAPPDDRGLPDLHFGFYDRVAVFDHVDKVVHAIGLGLVGADDDAPEVYDRVTAGLGEMIAALQRHARPLPAGLVTDAPASALGSNLTPQSHRAMVERAKAHIAAGDIFQVVLGQRFERRSRADPFDVYRALRVVNPSPYMVYMQAEGCILVASSPEILCRVRRRVDGALTVTNRPLAGTRRRGATPEEDAALQAELLADPKERAEHIMLVDLGRNDAGRVSAPGSVRLESVMDVERYSHVMHLSSTVTGTLRQGLDMWDALRAALPVGTISGAPKIRAMQIIDELEPVRRGPYGGGMGYAGITGEMDMALALRTIVAPTDRFDGRTWEYHIQAAGGIVADSDPDAERRETVNKAAALARAIELAERAFGDEGVPPAGDGA
ncbi:MAG: anthranilate synthase component I [Planctomycetota bacterium]|nr:MAG: anthranilate synthase component I [Planctomycetota bacterium]